MILPTPLGILWSVIAENIKMLLLLALMFLFAIILFKNISAKIINKPPNKNPIDITIQLIILSSLALSIAGFNNEKKLADIIIPAPNAKKQSSIFFDTFLNRHKTKRKFWWKYFIKEKPHTKIATIESIDNIIKSKDIDFNEEMIVIHAFTTASNSEYELKNINFAEKKLTIEYCTKKTTGINPPNASIPDTKWLVVKINRLDIECVDFIFLA